MFLERIDRPDVDLRRAHPARDRARAEEPRAHRPLDGGHRHRAVTTTCGCSTRRSAASTARAAARPAGARRARPRRRRPARRGRRRARPRRLPAAGARRPDRVGDLLARLVARGFARIKVGDDVVLDCRRPRASTSPAGRPSRWCSTALVLRPETQSRLAGSLEQALSRGRRPGAVELQRDGRAPEIRRYGEQFRCQACGIALERPRPLLFSFNHPLGACPECKGFGNILRYDEARVIPDPATSPRRRRRRAVAASVGRVVPEGAAPGRPTAQGRRPPALRGAARGSPALGVRGRRRFLRHPAASSRRSRRTATSSTCASSSPATAARFPAPSARAPGSSRRRSPSRWPARSIAEVGRPRPSTTSPAWLAALPLTAWEAEVGRDVLRPLCAPSSRSSSASASATSRSTARRGRCPAARRSASTSPTSSAPSWSAPSTSSTSRRSGSTRATSTRLAELCRELAHAGNTVVVVEHDRTFIEAADHCVELGPGLGRARGRDRARGAQRDEFLRDMRTLTARYLIGPREHPAADRPARGRRAVAHRRRGARAQPQERHARASRCDTLTCVTGVSGSGKSTLVHDTLYRAVARASRPTSSCRASTTRSSASSTCAGVRLIDQEPIGRTPRSNPVTYVKAFDEIRKLFAGLPRAKALGLGPGALLVQRPRRALRDLRGRRLREARDVLLRGRLRHVPRVRGAPLSPGRAAGRLPGARHQPGAPA